jgi:hypothetical protein
MRPDTCAHTYIKFVKVFTKPCSLRHQHITIVVVHNAGLVMAVWFDIVNGSIQLLHRVVGCIESWADIFCYLMPCYFLTRSLDSSSTAAKIAAAGCKVEGVLRILAWARGFFVCLL